MKKNVSIIILSILLAFSISFILVVKTPKNCITKPEDDYSLSQDARDAIAICGGKEKVKSIGSMGAFGGSPKIECK